MKKPEAQERVHWVCGVYAGGLSDGENQPFKLITTKALGESILRGLQDIYDDEKRDFINRSRTQELRREPFWCGEIVDIVRTPKGEVVAILEWRENETSISGHGGSGEEYNLCRATVAMDNAQAVINKWEAVTGRWMKSHAAKLAGRRWRRQREEVLRAHGLDQGTVLHRREEVLSATDIPKQYWD